MDKDFLIELTNKLYRLTLLFPKKEPLRYRMRELSLDMLVKADKRNLDNMHDFFEVALVQNWVSLPELLAVKEGYDSLRKTLEQKKLETKKDKKLLPFQASLQEKQVVGHHDSGRKEKIMAFLKDNGKAQVWQIKQLLPETSKRTLRRDFENLLGQGIIERIGERNDTFYKIKVSQS